MSTLNLFPTNTGTTSSTEMWAWNRDLWRARNEGHTHVSWGPRDLTKPRIATVTIQDFLNAVDNKRGRTVQTPKSWYVAIPLAVFQNQQTVVASVTNTSKRKRKSPSVTTTYKVVPTTDKKFGIQAIKGDRSKQISKTFETRDAAVSYIRGALRRPNYTEN